MLKEYGNLIEENIPITKELLDFAKANNYKFSLKTGDYLVGELKINRAKNNPALIEQLGRLFLNKELYPAKYCEVFGMSLPGFTGLIKRALGNDYIDCTELYPEEIQEKHRQSCLENLGVEYPSQSKVMRAKTEATNLRKFGVKCNLQLIDTSSENNSMKRPEVKAKARATNLKKLGVEYPMQSEAVREKSKVTCKEKYRVENPMQSKEIQQRHRESMVNRYGVEHALQNPHIMEKTKLTNLTRYGVEYAVTSPMVRNKIYQTNTERYGCWYYNPSTEDITKALKTPEAVERFETLVELRGNPDKRDELFYFITENYTGSQYYVNLNKNGFRDPEVRSPSKIETKLAMWLEFKKLEFIPNYKPEWMRNPETNRVRELDFWLPKYDLAIELNGDYTHSVESGKDEYYHSFKFKKCFENNIKLLMFTESEINKEFEMVCSLIEYHISCNDVEFLVDDRDKFRFALVEQSMDDTVNVESFKITDEFHHYYPVKIVEPS